MTDLILKAARELGIEPAVHVLEDHEFSPLVRVVVGTNMVQGRIAARWLMTSDTKHVRMILSDMHKLASNN